MSPSSLRRVAVGVDFGQPSIRALRWAARALGPDIELVLVHCLSVRDAPPYLSRQLPPLEERVRQARAAAVSRLERLAASLSLDRAALEVRHGRPAEELALAAGELGADLAVVGEHGPRRGPWGSVGSSASQLPTVSPVPVLIKRHLPERQPRRILAAVDASAESAAVLAWTRRFSDHLHRTGEVVVHSSVEPEWRERAAAPAGQGPDHGERHRLALAREWLRQQADRAELATASIDVGAGDPRYEILAVQRRHVIDLVVLGRRGSGAAAPPLIGSVATAVLQAAFCSVLVV